MSATVVPRLYSNFRGVDFRGKEINLTRSPDSLNMWRDYKSLGGITTRPSMKLLMETAECVHGIFFLGDRMFVHYGAEMWERESDGNLHQVMHPVEDPYLSEAPAAASFVWATEFGGELFMLTGENYIRYDGNASPVHGYIPTTSIGRKPSGGGVIHEAVNMLTPERINTFLADGVSTDYFLDAQDIDESERVSVQINGEYLKSSAYTVDYAAGKVIFNEAPAAPATDGQDNVSIRFSKTVPGYRQRITKCTLCVPFDNRIFFSGNPDHPNMLWHSALNDPAYIPDLNYYQEGVDSALIRGMVAGNNALWVFREASNTDNTVFYHIPTLDADYGKIYPSTHGSASLGCVGGAINFNDDIVFFSHRGMEGISGDITTEQAISHRSSLVDRKMIGEADYRDMILVEWNGYLMVFIGDRCYLADSRAKFQNDDHFEYDWYYWKMEQNITSATVHDGVLYLGGEFGVYTLTGDADLESYWVTPLDKFKYPNMQKTTNKRGCVVEAEGEEISVFAKTNKEADFQLIGTYPVVTDAFVSRIKKKKFKDLQLKFYSPKRFSLETATMECFVGGYIKR